MLRVPGRAALEAGLGGELGPFVARARQIDRLP
jgi:hypothetical protein